MFTKGHISKFWVTNLMSSTSKNALQNFTRESIVPSKLKEGPARYSYYTPWTDFFVDNMTSPNYFENKFAHRFGIPGYCLEKCGICFALFLFLKLIIFITVTLLRILAIYRITGKNVSFGKVLLSATYKTFKVSIWRSICSTTNATEISTPAATEMHESTKHIYPPFKNTLNNALTLSHLSKIN